MNDEKITVSMDEVERATPVPGSSPPPFFTPAYTPAESEPAEKPKRTGLKVGIAIAVVSILAIAGIGVAAAVVAQQTRTVQEYRIEAVKKYNEQLSDPTSALLANLRHRIQSIDPSLTITAVEITKCEVETLDGSDSAGRKDRNIGKLTLGIRAHWTWPGGMGYSDIEYLIDGQTHLVESSRIPYSTPVNNHAVSSPSEDSSASDDDFWAKVLGEFGAILVEDALEALLF